jgi:hypothetical protein
MLVRARHGCKHPATCRSERRAAALRARRPGRTPSTGPRWPARPTVRAGAYDAAERPRRRKGFDGHGRCPAEHRRSALRGPGVRAARGLPSPGLGAGPLDLRAGGRGPAGVLGRAGRPALLVQALGHGDGLAASVGEVVRRGHAERLLQLPRPARGGRRGRQGRLPLGGRARRGAHHHLRAAARGRRPVRERVEVARGAQGRPRRDLPGHDPRAPGRDARVRADRGRPFGGVRRVLGRLAPRPDQRRRSEGAHHRTRRSPSVRRSST